MPIYLILIEAIMVSNKLSRRHFLGRIGLAAAASALIPLAYCPTSYAEEGNVQPASYQKVSDEIDYTKIRERTAKKLGNETVKVEFGLESKLWKGLSSGMNEQEFYNAIKSSPIELKTTTIFGGISGIRGYINNEDMREEFLNAADRFIKNKPSQYDSDLTFSTADKTVLEKMLNRELKSSITETIKSWNPFASGREVYVYPPKSRIVLRTDRKGYPTFEMCINTNENSGEDPVYKKLDVTKITDETEKKVFTKFLLLSILTKDPDGVVPIDNFYREYQNKKS
ncbi:Uncharacterised protein [uncultured archaeon]|nr:Uncharacterised protein [uncultured archaeon]